MRAGLYRLHLAGELGLFTPSQNPGLADHPGVVWARVFTVVWRR